MHRLTNFLFFDTPLLYYYTNLNSSIICCLVCGEIYLSFGIFVSFSSVFKCNSFGDFGCYSVATLIVFSAILLPIKSAVPSAFFWIALFEAIFIASVVDCLALSISF